MMHNFLRILNICGFIAITLLQRQSSRRHLTMLLEEQGAYAYTLKESPGYCGDLGPVRFQATTSQPIWSPPRTYHDVEYEVGDEEVAGIVDAHICLHLQLHCQPRNMSLATLLTAALPVARFDLTPFACADCAMLVGQHKCYRLSGKESRVEGGL
jgi:hypothetical protein